MKYFFFTLFFILSSFVLYGQWNQLGQDIDGVEGFDRLGESVDLSENGNKIIIGASQLLNDDSTGYAMVYEWNEPDWIQLGQKINSQEHNGLFGKSVAMSSDGNKIAIGDPSADLSGSGANSGQVKCFEWNGISWEQLGQGIDGLEGSGRFGESIAISSNGTRLAIGDPFNFNEGNQSGQVVIYDWDGSTWNQVGERINGIPSERLGQSVSLSSAGNRLAIGAPLNSAIDHYKGRVVIFEWNGSTWSNLGNQISGENENDFSGLSIDLSCNGNIIAIGAPYNSEEGFESGHVRIFEWNGVDWIQKGTDLNGKESEDWFGYSVSTSCNGEKIAVGAPLNDDASISSGQVSIFQWVGNNWVQIGNDINGDNTLGLAGLSSRLSNDGNKIIVGIPRDNYIGKVKVYEGFDLVSFNEISNKNDIIKLKVSPNPTSKIVQINIEGILNLENHYILLCDINGKILKSINANIIMNLDLNLLSKGIYQIFLIKNKNNILSSEKLILK